MAAERRRIDVGYDSSCQECGKRISNRSASQSTPCHTLYELWMQCLREAPGWEACSLLLLQAKGLQCQPPQPCPAQAGYVILHCDKCRHCQKSSTISQAAPKPYVQLTLDRA